MNTVFTYAKGVLQEDVSEVVAEFPLALTVNGREVATLVASPHQLNYLVAGFLRLQGFVSRVEDFEALSVCNDYGAANVRIKGELPERLKPVLTSGCGTGITFTAPRPFLVSAAGRYSPAQVFALMEELGRQADRYRTHGGIHSAAVGDGERMVLYAEDLGRHNTLDRIAGEALLKGIELQGLMLVTSGRISTEMAAKAAQLGICLLASRTSPTDMAVKLCADSGITLIGYLRANRFQVYAHPDRLLLPLPQIEGVSGVILAGGRSTRMGRNKALLPYKGKPLIEAIYRLMAELFKDVVVVTNTPEDYDFLPCPKTADIHVGKGSLAGVHAGLSWAATKWIFVVGCDMPYIEPPLVRYLAGRLGSEAALVPQSEAGLEPLHAFYSREALPLLDAALRAENVRIIDVLAQLPAKVIPAAEIAAVAPGSRSFMNLNTPEDYSLLSC